jgi:hypothetical protein
VVDLLGSRVEVEGVELLREWARGLRVCSIVGKVVEGAREGAGSVCRLRYICLTRSASVGEGVRGGTVRVGSGGGSVETGEG